MIWRIFRRAGWEFINDDIPTVAAGAVTLLALAVLAALTVPRLTALRTRADAGDWRRPVALVGNVAVAAHDPDARVTENSKDPTSDGDSEDPTDLGPR